MTKRTFDLLRFLTKLEVLTIEEFIDAQLDARNAAGEWDDIDTSSVWSAVADSTGYTYEDFEREGQKMPAKQVWLI